MRVSCSAVSVTLTLKLAVPAAVGVPEESTTVPAVASVVQSGRRQPRRPGAEPGDCKGRIGLAAARHRDGLAGGGPGGGFDQHRRGDRERRIDRQRVASLLTVAPAVSMTSTVKLAVPTAVGVPLSRHPVPAAASVARLAAVSPVVPALKPEMLKVV